MSVRVFAQHVNAATLLVDNVCRTVTIGPGVVLYVCFLDGATPEAVANAVKVLISTRIFTLVPRGATPEATVRPKPVALLESDCDVLVVPQATLAGRCKGKAVQYHAQCEKLLGKSLYDQFCEGIRKSIIAMDDGALPCFDTNGVPKEFSNEPPEGFPAAGPLPEPTASGQLPGPGVGTRVACLHRLVLNGTYGNRQALNIDSPGPFSHSFEFYLASRRCSSPVMRTRTRFCCVRKGTCR